MSSSEPDVSTVVKQIINEAKTVVGSGPVLAEQLERRGVGPDTGRYSPSAVSNWINGRTMPPADVLLAAAQIAGVSLDERLGVATGVVESDWSSAVDELQEQVDALRAQVIELYGRTGQTFPVDRATEQPSGRRQAG